MYVQFCNAAKSCAYCLVNETYGTRLRHLIFSPKTRSRPRPRPLETTSRDRDVKTEITSWLGPHNTEQTNKPNICISAPNIWSRDAERERSERQVVVYKLVSREECLQNDRLLFWMGHKTSTQSISGKISTTTGSWLLTALLLAKLHCSASLKYSSSSVHQYTSFNSTVSM